MWRLLAQAKMPIQLISRTLYGRGTVPEKSHSSKILPISIAALAYDMEVFSRQMGYDVLVLGYVSRKVTSEIVVARRGGGGRKITL